MKGLFSRRTALIGVGVLAAGAAAIGAFLSSNATAAIETGAPAPAFSATDATGATRTLSEFAGQTLILEWTNKDCPFVVRHYQAQNMQGLQSETTGEGIVWLTVISSAPGEQGYLSGAEAMAHAQAVGASPTAILLDPNGTMGHAYGATNTPHMYIIDGEGMLRYQGAIDDRRTANQAVGFDGVTNYVAAALANLAAGEPVATPQTRAYGCNVKYAG